MTQIRDGIDSGYDTTHKSWWIQLTVSSVACAHVTCVFSILENMLLIHTYLPGIFTGELNVLVKTWATLTRVQILYGMGITLPVRVYEEVL